MPPSEFREKLASRAKWSGIDVVDAEIEELEAFFDLLRKWNRRIALTAFNLDEVTDPMLDRLFVEPMVASRHLPEEARVVDIGSGGGSPAIPLKLCRTDMSLVMVESRTRKAAFLRDAVRLLGLDGVSIAELRLEALLTKREFQRTVDVITVRAVKLNTQLLTDIKSLLTPSGQVYLFTGPETIIPKAGFSVAKKVRLVPGGVSDLVVMTFHQ
jgi:16S rRNA (guanine527-N7)-methyltransferase